MILELKKTSVILIQSAFHFRIQICILLHKYQIKVNQYWLKHISIVYGRRVPPLLANVSVILFALSDTPSQIRSWVCSRTHWGGH